MEKPKVGGQNSISISEGRDTVGESIPPVE